MRYAFRTALAIFLLAPCIALSAPGITLKSVASGLSAPVDIEHAGDGSGRLFIVQQTGQIRIFDGAQLLATPFLDISSLIVSGGERGLLGIAFHPNYASNGFFYVNYTRRGDGATVVARYTRSPANPNIADPGSALILLSILQPFTNHKGGQLQFGPDGYLYIGMGDGGSANDPGNRAQNLTTLLGKMLRIDVNHGSPYAVPANNPFQNDGDPNTLAEIWAYGLRNPWRFSFDRLTGDLFIADVGQGAREELNFQPNGSTGGTNYGWRVMEGSHCTGLGGGPACFAAGLIAPILEYDHSQGCSVTGGFRYRGAAIPALAGSYIYGDFCSGRIWAATRNQNNLWSTAELLATDFNISTFGEDQAGEIYVADHAAGAIYRISNTITAATPRSDFNSDGRTDLVWQHIATGQIAVWLMNGTQLLSSVSFSPSQVTDKNWRIAGTGDFNSDGKSDLVWQHSSTGQIVVWFMNATQLLSGVSFNPSQVADINWRIAGAGDFNSDGKPDLVWQHASTGKIAVWLMNGTQLLSAQSFSPSQESGTNWKIAAASDFNADGKPDLVWHSSSTGDIKVWLMDGITRQSQNSLTPGRVSDTNWSIVGVGDFNVDGKSDLIWQHSTSGGIVTWLMNGVVLLSGQSFSPGQVNDTNWKIRNR